MFDSGIGIAKGPYEIALVQRSHVRERVEGNKPIVEKSIKCMTTQLQCNWLFLAKKMDKRIDKKIGFP